MEKEKVTIENYQELAMRTCLPSAFNKEYAYYGVLSEIHELCSKIDGMRAKRVRDGLDFNKSNHLNKIADEIGDVLWFVALWCELLDVSFSKKYRSIFHLLTKSTKFSNATSTNSQAVPNVELSKGTEIPDRKKTK